MKELSKQELQDYTCLTVGELKKFLNKHQISDDSIVVVQRVEDVYYDKNHWGVYLKEGDIFCQTKQWNKDVESGKYLDKEKYPKINPNKLRMVPVEEMKELMEQYHPIWSCVRYKDDKDILFLDLHY